FVPREAAPPRDVIAQIHDAGGIASVAHPGLLAHDEWIPDLVGAGLDAIEVFHTNHDDAATAHYRELASTHRLAISGGSDYHADETHGAVHPGSVSLPRDDYERLRRAAASRATASGWRVSS